MWHFKRLSANFTTLFGNILSLYNSLHLAKLASKFVILVEKSIFKNSPFWNKGVQEQRIIYSLTVTMVTTWMKQSLDSFDVTDVCITAIVQSIHLCQPESVFTSIYRKVDTRPTEPIVSVREVQLLRLVDLQLRTNVSASTDVLTRLLDWSASVGWRRVSGAIPAWRAFVIVGRTGRHFKVAVLLGYAVQLLSRVMKRQRGLKPTEATLGLTADWRPAPGSNNLAQAYFTASANFHLVCWCLQYDDDCKSVGPPLHFNHGIA